MTTSREVLHQAVKLTVPMTSEKVVAAHPTKATVAFLHQRQRAVHRARVGIVSVSGPVTMEHPTAVLVLVAAVFLVFMEVGPTAAMLNKTTNRTVASVEGLGRASAAQILPTMAKDRGVAHQPTVVSERARMVTTTHHPQVKVGFRRLQATRGSVAPALAMAVSVALLAAMELMVGIETRDHQEEDM